MRFVEGNERGQIFHLWIFNSMVSDTAVDVAHKTIGVIILLIGLSLFCIGVTNVVWKAGLELEPPIPL